SAGASMVGDASVRGDSTSIPAASNGTVPGGDDELSRQPWDATSATLDDRTPKLTMRRERFMIASDYRIYDRVRQPDLPLSHEHVQVREVLTGWSGHDRGLVAKMEARGVEPRERTFQASRTEARVDDRSRGAARSVGAVGRAREKRDAGWQVRRERGSEVA